MTVRLFLDANILFSAAYTEQNAASRLFGLQAVGLCELVSSAYALGEARRNISAKRPARSAALELVAGQLKVCPEPAIAATAAAVEHGLPEKDAPILAAAISSRANILVTGDRKHFCALYARTFDGVTVMTLNQAFERLVG